MNDLPLSKQSQHSACPILLVVLWKVNVTQDTEPDSIHCSLRTNHIIRHRVGLNVEEDHCGPWWVTSADIMIVQKWQAMWLSIAVCQ